MPACWPVLCLALSTATAVAASAAQPCIPAIEPAGCRSAEQLLAAASKANQANEGTGPRAWIRRNVVRDCDLAKYGLCMADGWEKCDTTKPVVVMVHGFNSSPQQNAGLMLPIHEAGFACGTFAYPNDYFIRNAAQLLSSELRRFALQHRGRQVILVCHSMGSLVARECIEDSLYDRGNVERLIMIAPPTHGSLIAHFAVGTDVYEHWLSRKDGWPWQRVRDSIVDGLGEAATDLCPESDFLRELNAQPRNPRVRYTVLLGTGARLTEDQVDWIRHSVCESLAKVPGGTRSTASLDALLADIDELVEGKGDGVVAVKRGRLDGVSDTVIMPFGHLAVTGKVTGEVVRDVQNAVFARLQ